MAPLRVAVVGASGETGGSIVTALLESPDQFEVIALVRPASISKPKIQEFQKRGMKVVAADVANSSEAELAKALEGVDTVVAAVDGFSLQHQIPLANAAKAAGVKRFIPNFFGPPSPRGIQWIRDQKLAILDYINQLYLGYTVVEVGWWQQLIVPKLASGRADHAQVLPLEASPHTTIYGDGNVKIGLTHLRDIGRYVARIIADPRTLNKKVYVYGELATQNEVVALMEKVSGEKIQMKHMSKEATLSAIAEAKAMGTAGVLARAASEYPLSWAIRGDSTPEHAAYLGFLDGKELYPDFKPTTLEEFFREVLGLGSREYEKPYGGNLDVEGLAKRAETYAERA